MGRLAERIRLFPIVGIDTAVFIYHFEGNPTYLPLTRELFSSIETGERTGVTSIITLMEVLVRPLSLDRQDVARAYEALLVNFPNLVMADVDRDVIRQAAHLRAAYRIRTPDALQIGASLVHGAVAFITNDHLLKRLQDKLEVIILDDHLGD
jgi:predicted nucleic acid-binding protein